MCDSSSSVRWVGAVHHRPSRLSYGATHRSSMAILWETHRFSRPYYGVFIGPQRLYYRGTHKSSRPILWVPHSSGVNRGGLEGAQPLRQMFKPSRNFWNCSKLGHVPHTEGWEEVEPSPISYNVFSGYAVKLRIKFKDNRMKHNGNYWRVLTITNSIISRRNA